MRQGACRRLSQVDHFDHSGSVWFAGDDYGARNDKRRVPCLVQVRPDIAGLIPVVEVACNVDAGQRELVSQSRSRP